MQPEEKAKALKSLRLFERIPEEKLGGLSDILQPKTYEDGAVIFEEGSPGDALLLIYRGQVRIAKRIATEKGPDYKDLAILGAGECVGEMSLIEPGPRSARASAQGSVSLFLLTRDDLNKWLTSNPALMVGFFAELVHVLTRRLRRSSNELTLLFDLSQWLLDPIASGKELLQKVLGHLVPHIEGTWNGAAFLYNEFNDEMECVATSGQVQPPASTPAFGGTAAKWLDARTVAVPLPGPRKLAGYLLLQAPAEPAAELQVEINRTLGTSAGLIHSALENIRFRTEDELRARLKAAHAHGGF